MASLTWLGHAAFLLVSDEGKRIYVDPWLAGNPKTPASEQQPEHVDIIAVTHGHSDHVGDTVELSKRFPDAEIVAQVEVKGWLGGQGALIANQLPGLNKGGTREIDGIHFTLVNAFHSSSSDAGEYLGEPCGFVIRLEGGRAVYFAGDTCVFGDMGLIRRLYAPDYAVLPIGDFFTMGPREAALALELLGNPACIPCHYGTFPLLTGTPAQLRIEAPNATVHELEPGGSFVLA
jgi:L-ascorbate metabolism protein UlaG (beta-lactamase superfamily)